MQKKYAPNSTHTQQFMGLQAVTALPRDWASCQEPADEASFGTLTAQSPSLNMPRNLQHGPVCRIQDEDMRRNEIHSWYKAYIRISGAQPSPTIPPRQHKLGITTIEDVLHISR
jgi:hypothetical protein